jgi:arabinan endo-1,5-alpha-L-arabinosidase
MIRAVTPYSRIAPGEDRSASVNDEKRKPMTADHPISPRTARHQVAADPGQQAVRPSGPARRTLLAAGAVPAAALAVGLAAPAPRAEAHGPGGPDHGGPGRGGHRHDPSAPEFEEVSVHDPSIIRAEGQSYVFGSHLAAARSKDLISWTSVADGVTADNPLFDDVTEELADALDWASSDTLWAPDVHRAPDGRFRMYYCACEGGSPRSALGSAVADDVEGPYVDEGIFLRSGMEDEPSEDGDDYDAFAQPNVVDPQAFVAADGRNLLVYGSYSGGIFLLELEPNSGRPLPDQGYGTHLTGGNHARIEGPYILYSPVSRYYYLYTSFGGLDPDGGYNVRVGRSRRPEGPYVDAQGHDLRTCKADPDLPLFDDASVEPYAVKLMGGHEWDFGTRGEDEPFGYVSPGHMSAWNDRERGGAFMVFHSRFPGRGDDHEVRVHRLHLNRDDWPVLSPLRYAGEEPAGTRATRVRSQEVPGRWEVIDHGHDITAEPKLSRHLTLRRDGTIVEAGTQAKVVGSWHLRGRVHAHLELDGDGFDGVITRGWNSATEQWTPEISALSSDGRALWAVRG